jgi:hypothetical protein
MDPLYHSAVIRMPKMAIFQDFLDVEDPALVRLLQVMGTILHPMPLDQGQHDLAPLDSCHDYIGAHDVVDREPAGTVEEKIARS